MAALGYGNQPIDALIRAAGPRRHAEYARDLKALGYDSCLPTTWSRCATTG